MQFSYKSCTNQLFYTSFPICIWNWKRHTVIVRHEGYFSKIQQFIHSNHSHLLEHRAQTQHFTIHPNFWHCTMVRYLLWHFDGNVRNSFVWVIFLCKSQFDFVVWCANCDAHSTFLFITIISYSILKFNDETEKGFIFYRFRPVASNSSVKLIRIQNYDGIEINLDSKNVCGQCWRKSRRDFAVVGFGEWKNLSISNR